MSTLQFPWNTRVSTLRELDTAMPPNPTLVVPHCRARALTAASHRDCHEHPKECRVLGGVRSTVRVLYQYRGVPSEYPTMLCCTNHTLGCPTLPCTARCVI